MKTNYKTAKQLGITPEERKALIRVKKFIARTPPVASIESKSKHERYEASSKHQARFNMGEHLAVHDCGTAACIGGWMKIAMEGIPLKSEVKIPIRLHHKIKSFVYGNERLNRLFFPEKTWDYAGITSDEAIEQIELFLTTGEVTW